MPLCGETNKNNVRVFDENGRRLEMTGVHGDFASRPITQIPADARRQWTFTLDNSFPRLKEKGRYEVRLWYFSNQHDPASWKGRVEMDPVVIVRE